VPRPTPMATTQAGRPHQLEQRHQPPTAYGYDQAGNRTGIGTSTLTYTAARNQLLADGTSTYAYTAPRTLQTKTPKAGRHLPSRSPPTRSTSRSQTTGYARQQTGYDAFGPAYQPWLHHLGLQPVWATRSSPTAPCTYSHDSTGGLVATNENGSKLLAGHRPARRLRVSARSRRDQPCLTQLPSTRLRQSHRPLGCLPRTWATSPGYTDPTTGQYQHGRPLVCPWRRAIHQPGHGHEQQDPTGQCQRQPFTPTHNDQIRLTWHRPEWT